MKKIMMAMRVPMSKNSAGLPFRMGLESGGVNRPISAVPRRLKVILRREGDNAVFLWSTERHTFFKH
jgi:hypothetical protein